jgi:hypothetical protein
MAGNKIIEKVSKKTLGKKVDNVADFIDLISQLIVAYIEQRYKIKQKVQEVKNGVLRTLYSLKQGFIKSIVEAVFLITGILALIVGIVIWASRYVALEYIFIFYGLIVTIIVLLRMKVKI